AQREEEPLERAQPRAPGQHRAHLDERACRLEALAGRGAGARDLRRGLGGGHLAGGAAGDLVDELDVADQLGVGGGHRQAQGSSGGGRGGASGPFTLLPSANALSRRRWAPRLAEVRPLVTSRSISATSSAFAPPASRRSTSSWRTSSHIQASAWACRARDCSLAARADSVISST